MFSVKYKKTLSEWRTLFFDVIFLFYVQEPLNVIIFQFQAVQTQRTLFNSFSKIFQMNIIQIDQETCWRIHINQNTKTK